MKPRLEPLLLQRQIVPGMGQLLLKGDGGAAGQGVHVGPQEHGEVRDGGFRLLGVAVAQAADGSEGVVEEMGLDLGEHDVHALLRQFFLLPLDQKLVLKLDVDQNKQQREGHTDIHHGHAPQEHLGRSAAQRHEDIQQEKDNLPPRQSLAVQDHQDSEQDIAEQRNELGDQKQLTPLVARVRHIEKRAGERTDDREQDLDTTHDGDCRQIALFCPVGDLQIFDDVAAEEVQDESGGDIEKHAEQGHHHFHGRRGGVPDDPVGQVAYHHQDIGNTHA